MNRHVAELGEDAQSEDEFVVATVHDLFVVNGHVPTLVRGRQLRVKWTPKTGPRD